MPLVMRHFLIFNGPNYSLTTGVITVRSSPRENGRCGRVAQLGERHAYTVEVTGSSPVPPTMDNRNLGAARSLFLANGTRGFKIG
jgi:hypothetical protein